MQKFDSKIFNFFTNLTDAAICHISSETFIKIILIKNKWL